MLPASPGGNESGGNGHRPWSANQVCAYAPSSVANQQFMPLKS
jgi:hypothetical protein